MQDSQVSLINGFLDVIFFIIIEFSIKPSRDPTSDPRDPDLGRDLRLGTTVVKVSRSHTIRHTHPVGLL
jgi:hypothetical protein